MRSLLILFSLAISFSSASATIQTRIAINAGYLIAIDSSSIEYLAYNRSNTFDQNNALLRISLSDTLDLNVVNNDTVTRGFDIRGVTGIALTILPGDSVYISHKFTSAGIYAYYDQLNYPYSALQGLGGIISVEDDSYSKFFWNMKDHQKAWNSDLASGQSVNPADYNPDYFLINGKSFPDCNSDTVARVVGNVGDTLIIGMANTGQGIHVIHFHGFHCKILTSSRYLSHTGRIKDTFSIYPMETLLLQMIPDKPGEYPVHEHNLVAVTGARIYPNGMFMTMKIY